MVCLETTFIVDLLRGKKETKELAEFLDSSSEAKIIASPSIMEVISGAILNPKMKDEKERVIKFLSSFVILGLDKESSILAGEIEADLIKKGQIIEIEDIMIGAIAKVNNETLLTRNKKHFERIPGLKIESY